MLLSIDPWSMCQLYMFYSRKLRFFLFLDVCVGGGVGWLRGGARVGVYVIGEMKRSPLKQQ